MSKWNGLSLFSGIGGLDLAFTWAGGNILAFCEIDSYCQKVLRKHWPDVPIFPDIHELSKEVIQNAGICPSIDVIYGGFPCQPFSVAGKQKGKDDTRYLWPEFSRVVREIRPSWVVAENVPGILSIAADTVCRDLEREGYAVGIWDYEAAAVGAKHRRERIFFVAHAGRALRQRSIEPRTLQEESGAWTANQPERPSSAPSPNADIERWEEQRQFIESQTALTWFERNSGRFTKSELGRGVDGFPDLLDGTISPIATGIPNRTKRLKVLGNAVVPQQAYPIFQAIKECEKDVIQDRQ